MTTRRWMPGITLLVLLLGRVGLCGAQNMGAPEVPEPLKVPPGEKLLLATHASGAQIYTCTLGPDGRLQWILTAPDAELRDASGAAIIRHFAGPSWQHHDGSEVTGKAVAHTSPDPDSVPWLLLEAVSHTGNGVLSRVQHIQRIHTHGGQPPPAARCDGARQRSMARIAYTADYYFFGPSAEH